MHTTDLQSLGESLKQYIDASPTAFHAAQQSAEYLDALGAVRLDEATKWDLETHKLYYIVRDGSSVIAFTTGAFKPDETGVMICGAHIDSPLLKFKGRVLQEVEGTLQCGIEVYGGPIQSTWLDRDLQIAGRCIVENAGVLETRNFVIDNLAAIIPNAAIHMNREINKGHSYNPQTELRPLLFTNDGSRHNDIHQYIASTLGIDAGTILDSECFLVPVETADIFVGAASDSIIRSGRIDNLAGAHAILMGLESALEAKSDAPVFASLYNSEEIGSRTRSGAAGNFFDRLLDRFFQAAGLDGEASYIARQKSFQISIDGAHAVHPNYAAKHDPDYKPALNRGIALKRSAGYKYGTDALVASRFLSLTGQAGVAVQDMVNRADVPSGSTIGTISMAITDVPTVDVGIPMLAMHSTRETGGLADQQSMVDLVSAFYRQGVPAMPRYE